MIQKRMCVMVLLLKFLKMNKPVEVNPVLEGKEFKSEKVKTKSSKK